MAKKKCIVHKAFFYQVWMFIVVMTMLITSFSKAGNNNETKQTIKKRAIQNFVDKPTVMVTFFWSWHNIGDVAITPGLLNLFEKFIPEAEIILVGSNPDRIRSYLEENYPNVSVISNPFRSPDSEELTNEFREAFNRADIILYNSGTTLSYGRWNYSWDRTMPFALPLFLAREAGKPYGIYCQSFEKFAWPSDELFVPMLSDAEFVFCRDGNSLEYLRSLGVNPPILEFGPDATFGFDKYDKTAGNAIMHKYGLKPRQFITLTIRSNHEVACPWVSKERSQSHANKLRELIIRYIDSTGNDVLICPEVEREIEASRRLILEVLPEKTREQVKFRDEFWLPDEALSVYSQAEAVVTMEAHSMIMALAVGTPVLHPRFVEAGRKAWMLKDLEIEEWLFDIDEDSVDKMMDELMEMHNNFDAAQNKVHSAMGIVYKRQKETMAIVKKTLENALKVK